MGHIVAIEAAVTLPGEAGKCVCQKKLPSMVEVFQYLEHERQGCVRDSGGSHVCCGPCGVIQECKLAPAGNVTSL